MDTPPLPSRTSWNLEDLEKLLFPALRGRQQTAVLFLYYLVVLVALLLIYGRGDFETAPFVYQGF